MPNKGVAQQYVVKHHEAHPTCRKACHQYLKQCQSLCLIQNQVQRDPRFHPNNNQDMLVCWMTVLDMPVQDSGYGMNQLARGSGKIVRRIDTALVHVAYRLV